jgi:hypothetical protein
VDSARRLVSSVFVRSKVPTPFGTEEETERVRAISRTRAHNCILRNHRHGQCIVMTEAMDAVCTCMIELNLPSYHLCCTYLSLGV